MVMLSFQKEHAICWRESRGFRKYLLTDVAAKGVLGPLDPAEYPQIHTSRFDVILKSTSGKWWLIVDMS